MAKGVGAQTCDRIRGYVPDLSGQVQVFHRMGISGIGAQETGDAGGRFTLKLEKFGTEVQVVAWYVALVVMKGTSVTIEDDWGRSFKNCFIEEVGPLERVASRHGTDLTVEQCIGKVELRGVKHAANT